MQDPGGVGWPPPGLLGQQQGLGLAASGYADALRAGGGQNLPPNPSADSLSSFLEGRLALADVGAAQQHGSAPGARAGLPASGDDGAAPPLDAAAPPGPLAGLGLPQPHGTLFAHLTQQRRDSLSGRPMRGRVGSVASISEEDLFSSTGGLELGHDGGGGGGGADGAAALEGLAPADGPSRTLFVQNVPGDAPDEDIQALFAAHGELRSLYTACKGRGCVLVGYYDLRAATRAAQLLQGALLGGRALDIAFAAPKPGAGAGFPRRGSGTGGSGGALAALGGAPDAAGGGPPGTPGSAGGGGGGGGGAAAAAAGGRLDQGVIVVYNLDPDTTNEQLAWIFGRFGEVREIREGGAGGGSQKFIEFFDVRHAAAALRAMNRAELLGRPPLAGAAAAGAGGTPTAGALEQHGSGSGSSGGGAQGHPAAAAAAAAAQGVAIESAARSAASRGLVRPASQAVLEAGHAASPRLGQGPISHSWDPGFSHEGMMGALARGAAGGGGGGGGAGGSGSAGSSAGPLSSSGQLPGGFPLQQQLYNSQSQAQAQAALQQALQASGLFGALEQGGGDADTLSKLASAAQLLGGVPGPGAPSGLRPPGMHVSDSASSIASTQGFFPPNSAGGAAAAAMAHHLQSLNYAAAAAQQQQQQHQQQQQQQGQGQQGQGHQGQQQSQAAAREQHERDSAAAAVAQQLARGYGSGEGLSALGGAAAAAAAAAAVGGMGGPGAMPGSQSYGSLSLASLGAGGGSGSGGGGGGGAGPGGGGGYLLEAATGGDLFRPGGGLRSFSSPHLAAAAGQQNAAAAAQAAAERLLGAGGGGPGGAAAAAALLQAQAQAAAAAAGVTQSFAAAQQQHAQHAQAAAALQQQLVALQLAQAAGYGGGGGGAGPSALQLHQMQALLQGLGPVPGYPGGYGSNPALAAAAAAAAAAAGGGYGGLAGLPPTGALPRGASAGSLGAGGRPGAGPGGDARGGGRLSRRAADPAAEAERKRAQEKLFSLDAERILSGEDKRTTLMIKNIPNKYTQKMLLQTIEESLKGTFDFFYLPIDFKNKCNVGYAFINMTAPPHILPLVERFDGRRWDKFNSEKVCAVSYARIQGRAALISHFQNSSLMHEDKRCRPVLFVTDGPHAGEQEPFPVGTAVRPRQHGAGAPPPERGGGGSSGSLARSG
ncbi:hypothetical protein Rsub_11639 [Raphidocelis subcapitata]|uniref:RRM domain-containing protein n=1 Tax=Raphidocelis subcapitata TaxID=307507 RepID=A0A2V0PNE9_9CHLO|nr:hypothetical protein Rsub_11639 [Raphidocelis subcapitata]|eukprot:GBF98645.1 hypothetical protein Rsub_11639 [Raphidocelis subcapitata]